MAGYPKPKQWFPKNPKKYIGDVNNIIARSSWEIKFLNWADRNPSVIAYASEECVIPYISPVDGKQHRYFVDFFFIAQMPDGSQKKYLIEIKPKAQTLPPKLGSRKTNKYIKEMSTYAVNQSKWQQADNFAKKNGMQFVVLTEEHLF